MIVLASVVSQVDFLIEVNLKTNEKRTHPKLPDFIDKSVQTRPHCRPFGISWNNNCLFVANNKRIHRFTKSLDYIDIIIDDLPENSHQIAATNTNILVAAPAIDSLIEVNLITKQKRYLNLNNNMWSECQPIIKDTLHVNSILLANNKCFVNIHNRHEPSYIREYNQPQFEAYTKHKLGNSQTHNIGYTNNDLINIDTGNHRIISSRGIVRRFDSQYFLRGLCVTDTNVIVGASRWDKINRYHKSVILVLTRQFQDESAVCIDGEICDLRILDEFDYAHHVSPLIYNQSNNDDH